MVYFDKEDDILPLSPDEELDLMGGDSFDYGVRSSKEDSLSEETTEVQSNDEVVDGECFSEEVVNDSKSSPSHKFEQGLKDLENIVRQFEEDGGLDLEESLILYEKGIRLVRTCHQTLKAAEQKVINLKGKIEIDLEDVDQTDENSDF